ncbi:MAG TPA: epimerase [Bacteroidales bacterium]|nr:epimerase [Bacteroidales bacterium]
MKIGITGQTGFVGTHLYNFLGLQGNVERISFKDEYFQNIEQLLSFVKSCDVIVHLAAMNRHGDPQVIYDTNIELVKKLTTACELADVKPHILFSSSTQEEKDNAYGKSKLEGRKLLEDWAKRNKAQFTGLIIPNVFGPFGNPYYNSFIATFCHQLTHEEQPRIDVDGEVKLIYVGELVKVIWGEIKNRTQITRIEQIITDKKISVNQSDQRHQRSISHTSEIKVSQVLSLLESYKANYFEKGIIPNLDNEFEKNLFNTFLCYIDHKSFFPFQLTKHSDERGSFVETIKLNSGGQVSFSTTVPGITRGNHYHTRKAERFAVIKGKARIELRKIGTEVVLSFELDGDKPSFVDMPVWYTHNITNIGDEELYTFFWINEHFDPEDGDTYFENV